MSAIFEHDDIEVDFEGNTYTFMRIGEGIDISEQFDKPRGTMKMTYEIEGFEIPIYLVEDTQPDGSLAFTFGMNIGARLFVTVQDEGVIQKANELVFHMVERGIGYDGEDETAG